MYEIIYSEKALKALGKLERPERERILSALERLRIRPEAHDIKKLVGIPGYRLRVGDYRVIFDIEKESISILVLKIGHRKNIYD